MSLARGGEKQKKLFEEIKANFLNLIKTKNLQIKEAQWVLSTRKMKETVPKHIIIRFPKTSDEGKILKVVRRKKGHVPYKETKIKIKADCLMET